MPILRAELIESLNGDEPADDACRRALNDGAGFRVHDGRVAVDRLAWVYKRRVGHLRWRRIATIGADRLLTRLAAVDADEVRLGLVHSEDFNFTLSLDVDRPVVLAAIGVASSAANPDWDWSGLSQGVRG